MNEMGMPFTASDKRVDLGALAAHVGDGDCLAVGGGLSSRVPMAAVRAILRRGVRGLKVVGSAHGIDVDLLCGGGAVAASAESYVGFEQDFGMAPNYRRACEFGRGQGRRQLLLHCGPAIASHYFRTAVFAFALCPRDGYRAAQSRL